MSAISDALSTLSDRGLRRLLGARTFLRGLDYEKRKVVGDLKVSQSDATARIKGSDNDPYLTTIQLGGEGISSQCSCPAFQKTGHHCKHVAALLITVRNQARAQQPAPRRDAPAGGGPALPALSSAGATQGSGPVALQNNNSLGHNSLGQNSLGQNSLNNNSQG